MEPLTSLSAPPRALLDDPSSGPLPVTGSDAFFDLPVGLLCVARSDGTLQRISKAWEGTLGYSPEELLGSTFESLVHPDDLERTYAELSRNVQGTASKKFENRLRTKDGRFRILQWSTVPSSESGLIYAMAWDVTESREKEAMLRLLESVTVRMNDAVVVVEASVRPEEAPKVVFVNESFLKRTGFAPEDLMGKPTSVFFGPATSQAAVEAVRASLHKDVVATNQIALYRKDGTYFWAEYSATPVKDPVSGRDLWINVCRDITERFEAEQILRESEERYRLLFEANPASMWVYDAETLDFLAVNDAAVETYGYSRKQFLSMSLREIRPPEDVAELEAMVKTSGQTDWRSGIWTHIFADRSVHRMQVSAHQIPFMGRTAMLVLLHDVTEKEAAEAQLRESNRLLEGLIEASPLAIVALDPDGSIQTWNPAAERILGLAADDAVNRRVEDVLTGTSRTIAQLKELLTRKERFTNFEAYIKRHGERVDLSVSVSLLAEDDGKPSGMMAILEDISDQVRSQKALKELNKTLERRVAERTLELTSANKELEAFCFSVSHDLRGPLRSIDGFSRAILEDYASVLDEQGKDYLNRVRAASQRLGSLIDSLLSLARLTRAPLMVEELDLSAMAHDATAEISVRHPEQSVQVMVQPGLKGKGDPRLIRLVIENLLDNAWKFSRMQPEAAIAFSAEDVNGETVYSVQDNGAGFDMAYVSKLFQPFERLHSMQDFPGNGIGLATVERIVTRHGGRVWAKGAIGQGASFHFTLNSNLTGS